VEFAVNRGRPGLSTIVLACGGAVIVCAGSAVLLVDAANVLGLRETLAASDLEIDALYYLMYRDGGPVEIVQWSFISLFVIVSAHLSGRLFEREPVPARFWVCASILGGFMILEDAGNVRHLLADIGVAFLPFRELASRTLVEGTFYAVIATPAFVGAWYYVRMDPERRPPAKLILPGVGAYAVAAIASASRALGDWYVVAGHWVNDTILGSRLPPMADGFWGVADGRDVTAFMIMDFILEESIELMGATLLLAAAVAVLEDHPSGRS
jgi:hypothetical protein